MMRRLRNFWLGRRGSTAPAPGCGVLLKKLRSRWLVFEPTYCRSSAVPRPELALDVEAPLVLAGVGQLARRRDHVGPRRRARPARTGVENDSVGLAGSEVYVVTAAIGGLLVRNVNEFIWFGL